jgi:3-oxoacyl-[acyl-carrier protein] reductase
MKLALITGVSGSLGSRMALHLLDQGFRVAGLDIREPRGPAELREHRSFAFHKCDLRSPGEIESAVGRVVAESGPMELVINNAGIILSAPLLSLQAGRLTVHDFEKWREVIEVTLSATFYVTACCARAMVEGGRRGLILNISSICAEGNLGQPAYSAAKAGVNGLTAAAAKELGPLGIRVAALAPGYIDTESTRSAVAPEVLSRIRKRTANRRLGSVEDLLRGVDFIVQNSACNGKVLHLDGGLSL